MPFPADGIESAYKSNHIDDVKAFLDARYSGGRYTVYNLSGRSYPPMRLGIGRVNKHYFEIKKLSSAFLNTKFPVG